MVESRWQPLDQSEEAIEELIQALREQTQKFPQTVFLATGFKMFWLVKSK